MTPTDPADQRKSNTQRTILLATDSQNSVLAEVVGNATNYLTYSAYGHQSAQQQVATRLGFNGELREAHTCWYLLGNGYRAYNPRLMRFHSPDSWSPFGRGGLNPYMYCVGDPINRSDPTGHNPLLKFIFGVQRFLSGDPGFRVPGGGKGLLDAAKGQMINIEESRQWTPKVTDHSSASVYVQEAPHALRALTGPGALFDKFANTGGFRSSDSSYYTQRVTRRHSLPPTDTPPSYDEVMALSNKGTFASSQKGKTFVINRVSGDGRYYQFHPPQMEHPQLPPGEPTRLPRPRSPSPTPPSSRDSTPPRSRNPSGDPPFAGRDQDSTYAVMAIIRGRR
ncbi:RHS repeat-associated core domain-containing protein [Pseudomonas fluorescens]|uniref:RHS repeat-associated core domain-containing protein n=1 Tax=Pseudomonas fluorescens TaxID=294 RepID=A0A5E7FV40_PSEFL|nr:hypothetical protein PS710_06158 [Pseudomonas fluorescens]